MCCEELLAAATIDGVEPAAASFHVTLPPTPDAARRARAFVTDHGSDGGTDGVLQLLTSELVTNGVLHARTSLVLGITQGSSCVLVTVADADADGAPAQPPHDHERPSGRGLMLVEALASQWGVLRRGHHGKTVWFTLRRQSVAPSARGAG